MKSILTIFISVVVSVLIGTLFIDTSSGESVTPAMGEYGNLTAFQVGAYNDYESASNMASKYDGVVVADDPYFLVYVSLLSNSLNVERMMKYLDDKKIYYYVKTIDASSEFSNELYKYEELMKGTTSDVAFLQLNKKVLELYGGSYAS